jgi:hypothetical protein
MVFTAYDDPSLALVALRPDAPAEESFERARAAVGRTAGSRFRGEAARWSAAPGVRGGPARRRAAEGARAA